MTEQGLLTTLGWTPSKGPEVRAFGSLFRKMKAGWSQDAAFFTRTIQASWLLLKHVISHSSPSQTSAHSVTSSLQIRWKPVQVNVSFCFCSQGRQSSVHPRCLRGEILLWKLL